MGEVLIGFILGCLGFICIYSIIDIILCSAWYVRITRRNKKDFNKLVDDALERLLDKDSKGEK